MNILIIREWTLMKVLGLILLSYMMSTSVTLWCFSFALSECATTKTNNYTFDNNVHRFHPRSCKSIHLSCHLLFLLSILTYITGVCVFCSHVAEISFFTSYFYCNKSRSISFTLAEWLWEKHDNVIRKNKNLLFSVFKICYQWTFW